MRKLGVFFAVFLLAAGAAHAQAEPTDAQIRAAATTLGVSFDALKKFVQSQQVAAAPAGVIKVSAVELYAEFEGNQLRAETKYKGKDVQITGVVEKLFQEYNSANEKAYCLQFKTDNYWSFLYVFFKESELDKIMDLDPGATVTCVGRYTKYSSILRFEDAYLVK